MPWWSACSRGIWAGRYFLGVVGQGKKIVRHFTLYPLGYVPYSRAKVVPDEPSVVLQAGTDPGLEAWRGTWFGDIVGLARGEALSVASVDGEPETRQLRRVLKRGARLTGLTGERKLAETVAADLDVDLHTVCQAWDRMKRTRSWRRQAGEVATVLSAVSPEPRRLRRVLRAGARTGVWPPPWLWTGSGRYDPCSEA